MDDVQPTTPATPMKTTRSFAWSLAVVLPLVVSIQNSTLAQLRLQPLRLLSDRVIVSLTGDLGTQYTIESSTDLVDWNPIRSGSLSHEGTELFDFSIQGREFYRARANTTDPPRIQLTPEIDRTQFDLLFLTDDGGTAEALRLADSGSFSLLCASNFPVTPGWLTLSLVTNIVGLPFSGGSIGAALVETPDQKGLAAVLRIPIPESIDRRQLVGFTCASNGTAFYLALNRIMSNHIAIPVTQPGIYGCALASTQELATILDRIEQPASTPPAALPGLPPSQATLTITDTSQDICFPLEVTEADLIREVILKETAYWNSKVAAELSQMRRQALSGYETDGETLLTRTREQRCDYLKKTLKPYWDQAINNCRLHGVLIMQVRADERSGQLSGMSLGTDMCGGGFFAPEFLCAGFKNCMDELQQCCEQQSQGVDRVSELASAVRKIELLGIENVEGCFGGGDPEFHALWHTCSNLTWTGELTVNEQGSSSKTDYFQGGAETTIESFQRKFKGLVINSTEQSFGGSLVSVDLKITGGLTIRGVRDVSRVFTGECGTSWSKSKSEHGGYTNAIFYVRITFPFPQAYGLFAYSDTWTQIETHSGYSQKHVERVPGGGCKTETTSGSSTNGYPHPNVGTSPVLRARDPQGDTNTVQGTTIEGGVGLLPTSAVFNWTFKRDKNKPIAPGQ